VLIIVLVLAGWTVASVVVAGLASTVFRGARTGPATITLPPEYLDLRDSSVRSVAHAVDRPARDASR
jgi:hypothetical protein